MRYGVSYYPEQKTPAELQHDLRLLVESGINTVRMGEFAWCRMEPAENQFDFVWLDETVRLLGEQGIQTILCTPTACPPAWIIAQSPDILYMDNRRIRRPFGGRRHYCYNNPDYRRHCARITTALAEHFKDNPYVVGFQIDNEPAQEGTGRCCCPVCTAKFQGWMQKKYTTVAEFNRRSGSVFWSGEYTAFDQMTPPVNTIEVGAQDTIRAFYENPTLRLDFERFCSESQIEFQDLQTEILRRYSKTPITTNATGLATNSINYYESTRALDRYAFDYYPGLRDVAVDSFPYAFARGVKDGTPFWVLEFMSGGGHRLSGSGRVQPNPGALEQAVVQSFAHGAELMLHFQFRSFPAGAEQLNYAIVDMDGVPRRRYYEMQHTAAVLKQLEPLAHAAFPQEVALCVDYDTHWALRIKPVNDPAFQYLDYCGRLYRNLAAAGVTADAIGTGQDFSRYKVLVLPAAFVVPKALRQKLRDYVAGGGVLVSTFLTSVKNEDNIGYTDTLPAGLTDVFGIHVEEVEPVFATNHTPLTLALSGGTLSVTDALWSELLAGEAELPGRYTDDYKAGQGVISRHRFGRGTTWYFGTDLPDAAWQNAFAELCRDAGVSPAALRSQGGIEVVQRYLAGQPLYFIFNFTSAPATLPLTGTFHNYLTGETVTGRLALSRNGYAVLGQTAP